MTETADNNETWTIVVLERVPYWEPELARQFAGEAVNVRGCRSVGDLDALFRRADNILAVVDLCIAPADVLRWLAQRLVDGAGVSTFIVINQSQRSLEWNVRELGAIAVIDEFIGGHRLARLCRQQWKHPPLAILQRAKTTS